MNPGGPPGRAPEHAPEEVDVIVLTRDGAPPAAPVRAAITGQASPALRVHLHVISGSPSPDDPHRFATIARARNVGRRTGAAPWLMFVDDDVVLGRGCIARLVAGLRARPGHAALAADCLGQAPPGHDDGAPAPAAPHVGLGATLFRRDVLAFLPLRWEPGRCECRCCAEDLRRAGFAIDYLAGAEATHAPGLTAGARRAAGPAPGPEGAPSAPPRILCSFDRAHFRKFLRVFLASLRASGNAEAVTAFAYGLPPSEQRLLAAHPGVQAICRPHGGICPAVTRLVDFAEVCDSLPRATPVAYWDAGDVVFQARLAPLWKEVLDHPDQLLAARESFGIHDNPVALDWVRSIADARARRFALELLSNSPYLNAGFAAGTARTMCQYFTKANRLLNSSALRGSSDWGDQTALNLYCHSDSSRWREIPRSWNYALCRTRPGEFAVTGQGRVVAADGTPIYVAHGNAKMLPQIELSHLRD